MLNINLTYIERTKQDMSKYLLKRNENIHPHKDLYVKENNFIHSHQKLETTHVHQQVNR